MSIYKVLPKNNGGMEWKNELSQLLQIDYPIVQAPMLGVTTPEMVAAISNQGGLGSLPVGGLSPDKTQELILRTKALTNKPFAVNLFANDIPEFDYSEAEKMQDFLEKLAYDNQLTFERQVVEKLQFYHYSEQIEILLNENIPIVSFTFGILSKESMKAFKEKGVILIGTATCVKEARILDENGIDVVTAQGIEAGGHRGTFLNNEPLPFIGLVSLVPQIVNRLQKPILAAGGINDGKTIKAALILGAKGVQIGTAFVASDESAAIPAYKTAIKNTLDTDTVLTKAFSGRWARGVRNKFITTFEESGLSIPNYPLQGSLTAFLRSVAQKNNNKEFTTLWAGQAAANTEAQPAADIFRQLIKQTEEMV